MVAEKSSAPAVGKPRGRPFPKGVGGNPKGRKKGVPNKATREIKEIVRGLFTPAVWAKISEQLEAGSLAPGVLNELLHYGWGKPKETFSMLPSTVDEARRELSQLTGIPEDQLAGK